jgi:hypothetical protein
MLPELLELVDEGVLQLVERREDDIGEVLTQMAKDLLGGIKFGTVWGQIDWMHILWPSNLATAMTARTVQHDPNGTLSQLVAQMLQEELQALAFHAGKPGGKRLCRWWVPLPRRARATRTRLAR